MISNPSEEVGGRPFPKCVGIIQISRLRMQLFLIPDDTAALIESTKATASVAISTIAIVTERLSNIGQEVETITSINGNTDNLLSEADDASEYL